MGGVRAAHCCWADAAHVFMSARASVLQRRSVRLDGVMPSNEDLSSGEMSLLEDAVADDVSFYWILEHLDLLPAESLVNWRPSVNLIDIALRTVDRL